MGRKGKKASPRSVNDESTLVAMEGNIMEMPFFTTKDHANAIMQEVITYWVTEDRGIKIIPSAMGMPDSTDAMVFLYLLWKATREWKKTGIFPEKVHFTLTELKDVLKTRKIDRIKLAIERLKTTTYDFLKSFRKGKIYIDNNVRIFEKASYWSHESEIPKSKAKDTTFVVFGKEIIESIVSGYYKYIDFQKHQKLTKPLARRLHFLLAKRLGENREIQIGFKKLAQAIPLQTYTVHRGKSKALKYLLRAFEDLKNAGILDYHYDKEKEIFHISQPSLKLASMDMKIGIKEILTKELRALWLPDSMIKGFLDKKDWELIAGALEYIDKQKPQNASGFFLMIMENNEVPKALLKWSKRRIKNLLSQYAERYGNWKEIYNIFKEKFNQKYPDLKEGFLKYRIMRYELQKFITEELSNLTLFPEENPPLDNEEMMSKLIDIGFSPERARQFVENIKKQQEDSVTD